MFPLFNSRGVLGLNARSLLYIKPFNPKKATALADSKLKTKAYLAARGVPVAKLYGRIETREQLRNFDFSALPDECVLKPNEGFGGEGIIVLKGRNKRGEFLKNGKAPVTDDELYEHIEDILDGKFSIKGVRDMAFFEQILVPHECFARFRPAGLPDIRVIVFNLVPVMAMLRIPTAQSDGKANIHLGGIGIGIDIAKGVTTHAAQYHGMLEKLPHGESPEGHLIPYWDQILLICSRIQQITNIGYLAVDIAIDQHMGPALLEVNARAGLTVQLANLAPLRSRLERVQGIRVATPEKGVRIGQDLFGEKTSKKEDVQKKEDKPTLGMRETIEIFLGDGSSLEIPCKIGSDVERSAFPAALLRELTAKGGATPDKEKGENYKVKFSLSGRKIQTVVSSTTESEAVIGRRDLAGFLIDPSKTGDETKTRRTTVKKTDLRVADNLLGEIDRDLLLLKLLKPINLAEETERLRGDPLYNPVFLYPEPEIDLTETEKRLKSPIEDTSSLGMLLEKKRHELLTRLSLIRARGDASAFTEHSRALFGMPEKNLLKSAEEELRKRAACEIPAVKKNAFSAEKAAEKFRLCLESYSLHNWQVSVRDNLVVDVTVGGNNIYIRSGATFTGEGIASLIAHEIETHVLTSENGDHQHWALLRRGCAGYLETQEGLAIVNQNNVLSEWAEKRFNPMRNLIGLMFSLEHSFAETREYLERELGCDGEKALTQTIAMKRGLSDTRECGGFTKSVVYYRGQKKIEEFLRTGGDMRRLYIGKVNIDDIALIEEIPELEPPLILPMFLREDK